VLIAAYIWELTYVFEPEGNIVHGDLRLGATVLMRPFLDGHRTAHPLDGRIYARWCASRRRRDGRTGTTTPLLRCARLEKRKITRVSGNDELRSENLTLKLATGWFPLTPASKSPKHT